jgi:hypothetical protein
MTAFGDIHAMASLLGGGDPDDTEAPYAGSARPAAAFAPSALPVMKDDGVPVPAARPGRDARAIWTDEELVDDFDLDDDAEAGCGDGDGVDNGLKEPEFRFAYKQAVSTADAFLGMAHNKDPGTRSCEDLVLTIDLPGVKSLHDLDLDVKDDRLRLRSDTYKLSLYLPHRVDAAEGKAEWDSKKETLKITARILDAEYAF